MHNHDDKYPNRPGFEPGTSRLQAPVDTTEPSVLAARNIITSLGLIKTRDGGPTLEQCCPISAVLCIREARPTACSTGQENTAHAQNAVSKLGHRLRRWPNIETSLGECNVFAGRQLRGLPDLFH